MAGFCHVISDVYSCSAPQRHESHDLFCLSRDGLDQLALMLLLLWVALEVGVLTDSVICGESEER